MSVSHHQANAQAFFLFPFPFPFSFFLFPLEPSIFQLIPDDGNVQFDIAGLQVKRENNN